MTFITQKSDRNIIFIVGIGRSGTSLLQTILNRHSKIDSSQETAFVRDFILKNKKVSKKDLIYSKINRLNISDKNLNTPMSSIDFYNNYVNNTSSFFFLDKDPRLIESIQSLKKIFPYSKVICIYRNPLDVMHSKINAEWSQNNSIIKNILISTIQHKLFKKNRSFCLTLKYEDLINNPKIEIKKITKHLKINFEPDMLTPKHNDNKLVTNEEMQWKSNTLNPIDSTNIGKGTATFSNFQQSLVYELNKDIYQSFKYTKPLAKTGMFNLILIKLISFFINCLANIYDLFSYKKF